MKRTLLTKLILLLCALIVGSGNVWATSYISYNGSTQDTNTTISSTNVSSGTAGKISWSGKNCTYSDKRVNIAAKGSITFTADEGYIITKIVITSGSSASYYGTWTSSPSVSASSSSGVTTFDGLNANSVTVTTSTAFRCTSASSIKIYYTAIPTHTLTYSATNGSVGGVVYNTSTAVASGASVAEGGKVTLTATPADGYEFDSWEVSGTGSSLSSTSTNPTTFTMGTANSTVTANFVATSGTPTYTLTITPPTGGTGTCATTVNGETWDGSSAIPYGATVVSTATPNSGYQFSSWTCSYNTVTTNGNEISFTMPDADVTLTANYSAIPTHTATFSVNGVTSSQTVAEGAAIPFPADPADISGKKFVGWYTAEYSHASNAPSPLVTSATMSTSDVTYYAVFAEVTEEESDDESKAVKSQTLSYDTWTYSGSTTDKTSYRLFHTDSYIQSAAFDLSKLIKVVVKGGTFGGSDYNSLTIGDGTNTWKDVTVSGKSETGTNIYTGGTALSGTKALRITCNSGTASSNGVRISSVEIYVKGTTTTNSNYTTDTRPEPGIAYANASVDVKLTSGYTGQALTNTNSVTVTYSSSDETVATVNSSTGAITELLKAGSTTITATFAGNATYKPAEVSYTLNVTEKTPAGLAYATSEVAKVTTDDAFTNPLTNGNSLTVSYSSSATGVATVNSSTGEVTIKGAGTTTITATFAGNDTYASGSASYTLKVLATPTITISNHKVAYGETYEVDDSGITGGTITVTSGNESIATVDGLEITPIACGEVTITVRTAENETYKAGEATFTLTVTAPEGSDKAPSSEHVVFYESFNTNEGTGGNDDSWSGSIASSDFASDNTWTTSNAKGASACAKFGTGSVGGSATTPEITLEEGVVYTLTFKAGAWDGKSEGTSLSVSAKNATIKNEANTATVSSVTTTKGAWTSYTLKVIVTDESDPVTITFSTSGGNKRFFLDDVKVEEDIASTTVTLNKYGYATYCSVNPIDFSETEGYTAWRVSSIKDGVISFAKITEKIKGGQGVLLYNKDADGENTSSATIKFADGKTEFDEDKNLLVGTTAPTYFVKDSFYGLSGNKFLKNDICILPAGKAYLPYDKVNTGSGVRNFTFVFEDNVTGIETIQNVSDEVIFDLTGRRLNRLQKGVNIVNGKKILVK